VNLNLITAKGSVKEMDVSRTSNIRVYRDTIFQFGPKGAYRKIVSTESKVFRYKEFNYIQRDQEIQKRQYPIGDVVVVENTDSLSMLQQFKEKFGLNPLTVNFASAMRPGGGVTSGSSAQEENLFRRSNYFNTLDVDLLPKGTYPMKSDTVVYSPNVCVIKDENYELLDTPFYGDFIACAAVRNPKLTPDGKYKYKADFDLMMDKIDTMYKCAIHYNHDSIILGAFGCGAFHNPTAQVAEMFRLHNEQYIGDQFSCFKKIGFPVLSERGNPNYDIFKNTLAPL
jgi:uncharacterized protein (TIGR02452 family)